MNDAKKAMTDIGDLVNKHAVYAAHGFHLTEQEFREMLEQFNETLSSYDKGNGLSIEYVSKRASEIKSDKIRNVILFHIGFTLGLTMRFDTDKQTKSMDYR